MPETLVSIILPVYNVQEYITECLSSIAAQSFTAGVECIIVDDCGADRSMPLVQEFLNGYHGEIRFRIVRHERNRGLSAARNTGIMNAKGKYVLFIDSDDTISSDCLLRLTEVASKYPKAEMVVAGAKVDWKHLQKYYTMEKAFPDYADNPQWIARVILKKGGKEGIPVTAWNRLLRKDFLLRHQLFFQEGVLREDVLWNFLLSKKLGCVAFCKHNTYFYRKRPQSIMTSFRNGDENARSCLPVWHEILNHFTEEQEKEQAKYLWSSINSANPTGRDRFVRGQVMGILWQLVKKHIWPTSLFILIYMMPPIFQIRFIRKLIAKASSHISMAHISPHT